MPQLLLVRHGEPERKGVLLGRLNTGLSAAGLAQARSALSGLEAAVCYVSPLRRAQETAACLPEAMPRVTLEDLAEIGMGDWEGLRWSEVEDEWPELASKKLTNWFGIPAPGGERWEEIVARAEQALARMRQGPFPAIAVGHQGLHAVLDSLLSGRRPEGFLQEYCEVRTYDL
ncbi:MAG: histidine phosphatase family protein [Bryobacterales bacterium]|nr:histidine phosphatase family protein [Bryobacterales bacterium]